MLFALLAGCVSDNVALDALPQIKSVLPRPGGGSITADVFEYELRESRTGATIARVQVPQ